MSLSSRRDSSPRDFQTRLRIQDADPDIPILKEAKTEYAKLRLFGRSDL
jgi:hypothetical protein